MMLSSIPNAMTDPNTDDMIIVMYVLPGIVGGIFIYITIRTMKHMITLPICICIEMVLFYSILFLTNTSIHEATNNGWIRNTSIDMDDTTSTSNNNNIEWYHTWDYLLQFQNIDWYLMPRLIPNLIGMIFVVALSSSLDVTAIEIELQEPLNYNNELQMIGLSNIVSGCTGGYTGSYIFSQSIFSLRAGIRSRLAGFVLAFCELLIFILPIPILSYVPNFLFASLLIMISIDLMVEWLWDVRHRLTQTEYMLTISTFIIIQCLNVEYGILGGILLYIIVYQLLRLESVRRRSSIFKKIVPNNNTTIVSNGDDEEIMSLILFENHDSCNNSTTTTLKQSTSSYGSIS
jgi:MFS superfamily sulfate permease-like transporter